MTQPVFTQLKTPAVSIEISIGFGQINIDQSIDLSGLLFSSSQLEQQLIATELLALQRVQTVPQPLEFALTYGALFMQTSSAFSKYYCTIGAKISNAYLRWTFGEAATLFLRGNPPTQK